MLKNTNKLDQLTSLRFFAALMIVIHHSEGLFGIKNNIGVNFGQGVSFFFVLSGFILAYVYPKLDTWIEIKQFWRARVARIWPGYFASFLLGFWLFPYDWDTKAAIANLLMVQAWIPMSSYYFSFNGVSWSISTEFFFYFMFPFIITKWNSTWLMKLTLFSAVLIVVITISTFLSLPDYGVSTEGSNGLLITQHGLIYISPLSRIVEFVFGMCITLAWRKTRELKWSSPVATAYEVCAILFVAISMYYSIILILWSKPILSAPAALWLVHSGSLFAFGLLIYVMAQGYGKISAILAHPFLVLLGEISFSLYMLHLMLLHYYRANISGQTPLSNPIAFTLFLVFLLLSSYLMWTCIEMPGRRLIIGQGKIHGNTVMKQSWSDNTMLSLKSLFAGLALCCIIGFVYLSIGKAEFISQKEAQNLTPASLMEYTGIDFGNLFTLRGLNIERESDGLHIKLAWESKINTSLHFTNAIHLIDGTGKILGQADYKQPQSQSVEAKDIWLDTLFIPANKLNSNMKSLAIGLYDDKKPLLLINSGTRDWDGHRLIIHIDK